MPVFAPGVSAAMAMEEKETKKRGGANAQQSSRGIRHVRGHGVFLIDRAVLAREQCAPRHALDARDIAMGASLQE